MKMGNTTGWWYGGTIEEGHLRGFQREAEEKLSSSESILISAPTGLGKTRAAILPFVSKDNKMSTRIIYTLPIRALAKGVHEEFLEFKINPVIHHGEEPESEIFSERAIITTIDQYFTAFAGAPLSWSSSVSHAATGAVLNSYTVFDEVHLLSPQKGLPLLFAILKLRHRWYFPTAVMTATLPNSVIDFLNKQCGLKKVEASENDIKERDDWRVVSLSLHDQELDSSGFVSLIEDKHQNCQNKMIVFVNTVDRAIRIYKKLQAIFNNDKILLAHSRFTKEHRKRVEKEIHEKFGKDSEFNGILITTQVAEAGLNISAPLVITELSPMDSLIQRAGRCARFKSSSGKVKGEVIVVKPKDKNWYTPYFDYVDIRKGKKEKGSLFKKGRITIAEITWLVLKYPENSNTIRLDWGKERELLNYALNDIYSVFIEGKAVIYFKEELEDKELGKLIKEHKKELEVG
ncbi:MAG: CRISPR-associated helicase Cas3' [Methanophagales archaeon]|nr:CRISPR-associated helicase Cas3' [Methanophagales archaeon]